NADGTIAERAVPLFGFVCYFDATQAKRRHGIEIDGHSQRGTGLAGFFAQKLDAGRSGSDHNGGPPQGGGRLSRGRALQRRQPGIWHALSNRLAGLCCLFQGSRSKADLRTLSREEPRCPLTNWAGSTKDDCGRLAESNVLGRSEDSSG